MIRNMRTLRVQINVAIALTLACIAVIYSLILVPFENARRQTVIKEIELSLNAIVEQRAEPLANELFLQHREAVDMILKNMSAIEGLLAIGVFQPDGRLFTATESAVPDELPVSETEGRSSPYTFGEATWKHQHVVIYTRPIIVIGERLGYVRIYYSFAAVAQQTRFVVIIFTALLFTILAAMAGLLHIFLSRFVLHPVATLMQAMRTVQAGHLGEQVRLHADNEIGEMARVFNQMSAENARMYQNIEKLVKERTAELSRANEHLRSEIAERRRMEVALQEREAYLRTLIDNLPLECWAMDTNWRYTMQNAASRKIVGNVVGKHIDEVDVPDQTKQIWIEEDSLVLLGHTRYAEYETQAFGQQQIYENLVAPVWMGDQIIGLIGTAIDITRRKRIEAELQHAKEAAEAANQAKSQFLANMNHELRSPLTGIVGYTQILKRDSQISDDQRQGLEVIERCSNHLLQLINNILDMSKIEAHKLNSQIDNFRLPDFFADLTAIIQVLAQQKGLAFQVELDPLLPRAVCGDEIHLRQVLFNLLSNAVKFTEFGSVTLRALKLETRNSKLEAEQVIGQSPVSSRQFPVSLRFEVEDTGMGIPTEDLDDIFAPFVRLEQRTRKIEGTGLGLAISRELVRLLGGQLQVRSTVNQGSTFWFELCLAEVSDVQADMVVKGKEVVGFQGETRKVLIVDDNKEHRMILVRLLAPLGFELTKAEHGKDALECTLASPPDLILLDLTLPEMDGFETARRIQAARPDAPIPIIAMSATPSKDWQQRAKAAGCAAFLGKPIQAGELFEQIGKLLSLEWIYADSPVSEAAEEEIHAHDAAGDYPGGR